MKDSFKTKDTLNVNNTTYEIYNLKKLPAKYDVDRLPFSLKILLENLLRCEDGISVRREDIEALLNWDPKATPNTEIAFTPSRVILQDFTGVPAVVDLAAMREAMKQLGGNPTKINPLSPVELVIDHSVMVDYFGTNAAFQKNTAIEIDRNHERYVFLRWGQQAFQNFKVVPPGTGIVHQVNLEYLARVIFGEQRNGKLQAFPDTLVGTDSHTTMINGLGVLGWGVGGIEAEAAMLGQPVTMLIPQVIGFKLSGQLPSGATGTDLVLTVTEILRKKGVVGKFVEFFGDGLDGLSLADRATIGNMAPEYGATCGIFPIDNETLNYLALSGRDQKQCDLIKTYAQAQGLFRASQAREADYTDVLSLDLADVVPCIAGPKRPQDKINLRVAKQAYHTTLESLLEDSKAKKANGNGNLHILERSVNEGAHILDRDTPAVAPEKDNSKLHHGSVVIAAITSCTNTSNPAVMIAAGLIAKNAHEKGLKPKTWVKTSLAPGSQVVTDYLEKCGLMPHLDALGFNLVGYGCTTCIGNSGPLPEQVSKEIKDGNLAVAAVLSGNRNFEGRIHPEVRHAFLASPPLVVIYALAGTMDIDLYKEPLGKDAKGQDVYMKDLWPSQEEIQTVIHSAIDPEMFSSRYSHVFTGDEQWRDLPAPSSELFAWDNDSTYVKNPPYFEGMKHEIPALQDITKARVLAKLGDSVTTDHISPAGSISPKSPAGEYLQSLGVAVKDFNSYGSRRGNHEVMIRGTFANIRLRNQLAPNTEGGWTCYQPSGEQMSIYDAAMRYKEEHTPLIILAGKEYGSGSSRDWAAKGTNLLGVKAVIAESFERIHRSNLIGMGVLPLEFVNGENPETLKLTGKESYSISLNTLKPNETLTVEVEDEKGNKREFKAFVRIDTPKEMEYYHNGGILHYVLRNLTKTRNEGAHP
ncbi:MAG: aconitate hydratase 1 [Gammaproteobacteria bacterium 39-13]|nr:aconitate hydratase AcnA [Gammaproteobacteria bacterium]OJV88485.1 MAG: aconitate hydratase 1 [Gammaproteobacteria bacterium 39-13]